MFVYLWTNTVNGKKYIGRCAGDEKGPYKGSGKYFRRAYNKWGEENFSREILKYCDSIEECKEVEQYYLDLHDASNNKEFYNISPSSHGGHHGADYTGERNPMYGKKHPNHVPHCGKDNGMYGVHRYGAENPNAKKTVVIDPNGKEYRAESLKEICLILFEDDANYGKLKHLVSKCKEGKKLRSDSLFYKWEAYYECTR